jgi:hypothetical protein
MHRFCHFLGKCKVDNTEKGWFITYIDRDPETLARQKVTKLLLDFIMLELGLKQLNYGSSLN